MKTRSLWLLFILTTFVGTSCSKNEEKAAVDNEVLAVISGSGIDTQYISEDFAVAAVVHPGKILNSPLIKMLRDNGVPVEKALKEFTTQSGIEAGDIEQVIFMADRKTIFDLPNTLRGAAVVDGRTHPGIGVIVRFSAAVDEAKLMKKLPFQMRKENGKTYYDAKAPDDYLRGHFVDGKTFLLARKDLLPKMMAASGVSSPLTKVLGTANPDDDLMIAIPMESMKKMIDMGLQGAPPPVAQNADLFRSIDALVIAANLSGDSLLNIRLDLNDADSAKKMTAEVQKVLGVMKKEVESSKSSPPSLPSLVFEVLMPTIEELVNGISVEQTGKQVVIDMRSISLEKLKPQLEPAMKAVREEEKITARKNVLKQIGIAFHAYEGQFGAFPTASSANETKGKGLSWRVHLLPLLDQGKLYKQFHLKEPWDSDHNKKLMSKMPKIFEIPGRKNDGKTNIHVFTGKGTPFNGPKPIRISDITDGTSNTIMCVITGEDKADFWTKPGGITLTPGKNLWVLLGLYDSKRVLVVMMDGSVMNIDRSFDSRSIRWMILYNDGDPLRFPKKTQKKKRR